MNNITEEQKQKIQKIFKEAFKSSGLLGLKYFCILLPLNVAVALVNALYVHSETFILGGYVINAIFVFKSFSLATKAIDDKLKADIKAVLSEK